MTKKGVFRLFTRPSILAFVPESECYMISIRLKVSTVNHKYFGLQIFHLQGRNYFSVDSRKIQISYLSSIFFVLRTWLIVSIDSNQILGSVFFGFVFSTGNSHGIFFEILVRHDPDFYGFGSHGLPPS